MSKRITEPEGITVLSLFDGKSGGQIALQKLGIKVKQYYASEIDKHAIKVTQHNFHNTIQLGSVIDVDGYKLPKIDLLIGGSPCQSFSFAGKRKGMSTKCETEILTLDHYLELKNEGYEFEGQSYLFWEYMRLLNEVKPKYFLLENVMMGEKWEKVLSKAIGVKPIEINSALVSAQNRRRLYWFGQIRERLYYNDNLCYLCLKKENEQKKQSRILGNAQGERTSEVLGETQERQSGLQNLSKGIFENRKTWNNKDLLGNLQPNKQKECRQEQEQREEIGIPKEISKRKSSETFGLSKKISANTERKGVVEENRRKPIKKDCQNNEDSSTQAIWTKEEAEKRRIDYNSKYGTKVCCMCCGKELDYRPHHSVISWGNERFEQFTSFMSELQFNEARQNNGRVFDTYKVGIKGDSLFGETINDIPQPKDKGILLRDILETDVPEKYYLSEKMLQYFQNNSEKMKQKGNGFSFRPTEGANKAGSITTKEGQRMDDNFIKVDTNLIGCIKFGRTDEAKELRKESMRKGKDHTPQAKKEITGLDFEKMNTLTTGRNKDNLVMHIPEATKKGYIEIKPGECFDFENPKPETRRGRKMEDKSNCLMAKETDFMHYTNDFRIRRLTPVECERLQTVPDNYTNHVSDTQRYRMLGNGWTVDVIAYIFSYIEW